MTLLFAMRHDEQGGEMAITDHRGKLLWGTILPGMQRTPLIIELEPVGYLASSAASSEPSAITMATVDRPSLASNR